MSDDVGCGCFGCLGSTPPVLLFIVFAFLKLTESVTWSWWIVTSPLWLPISLFFVVACLIVILAMTIYSLCAIFESL